VAGPSFSPPPPLLPPAGPGSSAAGCDGAPSSLTDGAEGDAVVWTGGGDGGCGKPMRLRAS
jgi:hypothetical protein